MTMLSVKNGVTNTTYDEHSVKHKGGFRGGRGGHGPPPRNGQARAAPPDRAGEEGKRRKKYVKASQDRRCHAGSSRCKQQFGERSFTFAGPSSWNSLPADLQKEANVKAFKKT